MVDFNGMTITLGLFYAKRLGNRVHCMFIFTFFVHLFLSGFVFAHGYMISSISI